MCFSSGVYLYFMILMYIRHDEQFKIGCGAILNKIYYYKSLSPYLVKLSVRICLHSTTVAYFMT